MTLSDRDIKKYIKNGKIKIYPKPNLKERLGPCSLDLSLGNIFKVFNHVKIPYIDLKGKSPFEEMMEKIRVENSQPFILQPGDFVLAITNEKVKLSSDIMARLDGRSSLGRLGIIIHITAARIDPGFEGKLAMELGNVGVLPVALYPGMKICSLTFEILSSPSEIPYYKKKEKKYLKQKTPLASKINQEFRK